MGEIYSSPTQLSILLLEKRSNTTNACDISNSTLFPDWTSLQAHSFNGTKKISGGIYLIKKNKISHIVRKEACLVHQHGSLNRPTNQKFAIARFLSDAVEYTSLGNKHPHTQSEQKKVLKAKQ